MREDGGTKRKNEELTFRLQVVQQVNNIEIDNSIVINVNDRNKKGIFYGFTF